MSAPGVVVVHDWYGLLPHVHAYAEALEDAGFTTRVVDLYDGASTTDESEAESLMEAMDSAAAAEKVVSAVRDLRHAASAPRIGAVSFSMGGMVALRAATQGAFDAVVAYYAALMPTDAVPCPVQLHLAAVDDWDPPDFPEQFVAALQQAGGVAEAHSYPGTEHSFANADVKYHDPAAADLARTRAIAFLRATLGAGE